MVVEMNGDLKFKSGQIIDVAYLKGKLDALQDLFYDIKKFERESDTIKISTVDIIIQHHLNRISSNKLFDIVKDESVTETCSTESDIWSKIDGVIPK